MASLYWYRGAAGAPTWDSKAVPPYYDNWWLNYAHTSPSTVLPGAGDSVYFLGTVAPATGPVNVVTINHLESREFQGDITLDAATWSLANNCSIYWGNSPSHNHTLYFKNVGTGCTVFLTGAPTSLVTFVSFGSTAKLYVDGGEMYIESELWPKTMWIMGKVRLTGGEWLDDSIIYVDGVLRMVPTLTILFGSNVVFYVNGEVITDGGVAEYDGSSTFIKLNSARARATAAGSLAVLHTFRTQEALSYYYQRVIAEP